MFWHHGFLAGVSCDENEEGLLCFWAIANFIQKAHRVRRMYERGEPGLLASGNQQARRDADTFMNIVILAVIACIHTAAALVKYTDQPRCNLHIWLV